MFMYLDIVYLHFTSSFLNVKNNWKGRPYIVGLIVGNIYTQSQPPSFVLTFQKTGGQKVDPYSPLFTVDVAVSRNKGEHNICMYYVMTT